MTLYLLDTNVLIRAHEDYYPWAWLLEQGAAGRIKKPKLIFHEVTPPLGPLADWIKQEDVKVGLILQEDPIGMGFVLGKGYAPDLNDVEIEEIGKDPFLIAAALAAPDRVVVTKELSRPSRTRARRMAPDVCKYLGIEAIDDYRLYKILKFSIP